MARTRAPSTRVGIDATVWTVPKRRSLSALLVVRCRHTAIAKSPLSCATRRAMDEPWTSHGRAMDEPCQKK
jgi:hypothetical protein